MLRPEHYPDPLASARLTLEPLQAQRHYGGVRRINSDAQVMRYITGHAETPAQTMLWLSKVEERWRLHGDSWWAVLDQGDMVGAVTLQRLESDAAKPYEIGWRLARQCHGKGYATEAAARLLQFARDRRIAEVVAVADPANTASLAVMARIGMRPLGLQTHYQRTLMTYAWRLNAEA